MAQFDVHPNRDSRSRQHTPYFLDLQSDLLDDHVRRVVAPLVTLDAFGPTIKRLNPIFEVEGRQVVMSTLELASVPRHELTAPVASLTVQHDRIVAAVDYLMMGI